MRISTLQITQRGIEDMQRVAQDVARSQQQIASGKRIARPSDDPVGAAKIVALRREIAQRESFITNANAVEANLVREEAVIRQVLDVIQRVQELVLQAGNGAQTLADRQFVATEIESRMSELTELMNSKGPDGKYLFAGHKGDTQPFVVVGSDVRYQGDEGQRLLQVDNDLFVPFSDSGRALFMDIPAVKPTFRVENHPGNASTDAQIAGLGIVDEEALAAHAPEDLLIEFQPLAEAGGVPNLTISRLSDGRIVDSKENVPFVQGVPVVAAGMQFTISGDLPQPGDRFVVRTTETQSLLETVGTIAKGLVNVDEAERPETFRAMIDDTIANLGTSMETILRVQSEVGARLNTVSAMEAFHSEQNLATEAVISEVRDLDYAEAVSNLSFQSFVLEAAQQSFIRVSRLSLFNSL